MAKLNPKIKEVTAFAPATVTNVSCGFDVLGFALNAPGDEVVVRRTETGPLRICCITGQETNLPLQADRNTAGVAVRAFLRATGLDEAFEIEIHKKMAIGTGLGSSAASAVAAVVAVNQFLKKPLSKAQLLPFALQGEKITSGSTVHADNVAAALWGGFVVVRSAEPADVIPLNYPLSLTGAVVHPHIKLPTSEMRKILRQQISLHDAVRQWGNIAAFVAGLQSGDLSVVRRSLQDVIVEPIRSKVIPGYEEAKQAAVESGALGSGISGSGPSVFALCDSLTVAEQAGKAMKEIFWLLDIEADLYISTINAQGAKIVDIKTAGA